MNLLRQGVQGMYDLTLEHNNAKDAFWIFLNCTYIIDMNSWQDTPLLQECRHLRVDRIEAEKDLRAETKKLKDKSP